MLWLIEDRKAGAGLRPSHPGIAFNKHFDVEGTIVFHHACSRWLRKGIVSKAGSLGSPYRFGQSADWIKVKNPAAPAVKREAEEEWRVSEATVNMNWMEGIPHTPAFCR